MARGGHGMLSARTALGAIALTLLLCVPSAASTLSFDSGTYTFSGTGEADVLNVAPADGTDGIRFTDDGGEIAADPSLPADCSVVSESEVRCTGTPAAVRIDGRGGHDRLGTPARRVSALAVPLTLDGATHDDELRGGRGDDVLLGGGGSDTMIGGLGADRIDGGCATRCERGFDQILHDYDGRGSGVDVDLGAAAEPGPDPGDAYARIEGVGGTRYDDTIDLGGRSGSVFTGSGADFIDGSKGGEGQLRCGAGREDVAAADDGDRAFGCERAGASRDPEDWVSGFLESFSPADFYGPGLTVGAVQCKAGRKGCRLDVSVRFSESGFTALARSAVMGGDFPDIAVRLTSAQLAALRADGKQDALVDARLSSRKLPPARMRVTVRVPRPGRGDG